MPSQRRHRRECERPSGAASISVGVTPIVMQRRGCNATLGWHTPGSPPEGQYSACNMRGAGRGGQVLLFGEGFRPAILSVTVPQRPTLSTLPLRTAADHPFSPPPAPVAIEAPPLLFTAVICLHFIHVRYPTFPSCHATQGTQIESKAQAARQCRGQLHIGDKTQATNSQVMEAVLLWVLSSRARSESHGSEAGLVGHRQEPRRCRGG